MIWIGIILILLNVFIAFVIKVSRKTSYWGRLVLMIPPIAIIYGVATLLFALFYLTKYYLKD
jgi:uncharacterized membrane protein